MKQVRDSNTLPRNFGPYNRKVGRAKGVPYTVEDGKGGPDKEGRAP